MGNNDSKFKLIYGLKPDSVFITENPENPEINKISLNIANPELAPTLKLINTNKLTPDDELLLIDDESTDKNELSWFFIWFPWGEDKGDITAPDNGSHISISPASDNKEWYCS